MTSEDGTVLWTSEEIARATGGVVQGSFSATGVTFDSREVEGGDLFIALRGEATDGHRFVPVARERGAAGLVVSEHVDGPHVLVADTTDALDALARASRARTQAAIVGVTGSAGKTGTKEALFAALARQLPGDQAPGGAHRSVKSYNNHTGVPLSLARMPAAARFGVFEMGMNHSGELAALTRLVRPHVAVVTTVASAHREFFRSEEEIADAKGEIFEGLEPGGTALVPFDNPHRERLRAKAERHAARVLTFGTGEGADVRAREAMPTDGGTLITAVLPDQELTFTLSQPGAHWVGNAMAVLGAVWALGGDLTATGLALAELEGLAGRGARVPVPVPKANGGGEALVIDESYNANPASMAATLASLGAAPGRKLAVLGPMRELGDLSARFHRDLAGPIRAAGVTRAILVGPEFDELAGLVDATQVGSVEEATAALRDMLRPGDHVLVKGSNSVGLARLVAEVKGG